MTDQETLMAELRQVLGPDVNDVQLRIVISLVNSHNGRRGGRPPQRQIDVTKPVTPPAQTGLETPVNGGLGGSVSGSLPGLISPDPSKQIRRRYNTMSAPQGFHDFWALYPRHVAKKAAIKAWMHQIGVDVKLTLLALDAIRWQAEHTFAGKEEDKIPHASTWLNGHRWEDERKPNGSNGVQYRRLG